MFTIRKGGEIDRDIQQDMEFIISAIEATVVQYDSIYLVGSFGRGEGSVRFDGSRWKGINDYDLVVICPDDLKITLSFKDMGNQLARLLGIDFVDIGCLRRASLRALPATIENYDLKYASLLLAGEDVRREIPDFQPEDISPYDFVRLLCNRAAGLLTTWLPEHSRSSGYCANQYVKACIAVGDIAVYLDRGYHHSYQERLKAFRSLIESKRIPFSLSSEGIDCVLKAYEEKLAASCSAPLSIKQDLMQQIVGQAFCAVAEHCTAKHLETILAAESALNNYYRTGRLSRKRVLFWNRHNDTSCSGEMKNLILFSQPVFYCHSQSPGFRNRFEYFRRFWVIPGALQQEWSSISAVMLWEEYCH